MSTRRHPSVQDIGSVMLLLAFTAIVAWNRATFDFWLARLDIFTQFLPWYDHLGDRMRALDVPGWNPHLLSGTPFAGHPLSGWMYAPAMLSFAIFPVLTGFKVMMATHLVIAGLSMYAFARVLGMAPLAALVAGIVFTFGPFLEWNTYTSLQFGQFAAWVPLLLLGIELALRAKTCPRRLVPWCLAGVALSQMLAGWVGEGWIYAALLVAAYTGYRAILDPPHAGAGWNRRLTRALATSTAVGAMGAALGMAGIWPRLTINAQTQLADGDYSLLGEASILNPPWDIEHLFAQVVGMGSEYHFRAAGFGGAVVVLAVLAPFLAKSRFAVPFFAGLTVVSFILTLHETPLHQVFYLIPRYESLHEHDPWRVIALASVGPVVLSGATVESLSHWRGQARLLPIIALPVLAMALFATTLDRIEGVIRWPPLIAAIAVTVALLMILAARDNGRIRKSLRWIPRLGFALIVAAVVVQPTALELSGSWLGWPRDPRWAERWESHPWPDQALKLQIDPDDVDGAGGLLKSLADEHGPYRYVGYGGVGYPDGGWAASSYTERPFDANIQAILVNGRSMFLDLSTIQGYDPNQLSRYAKFMTALNGEAQDYHFANLKPSGVQSPLLDLLSVRYVLVDATLPQDRDDIVTLTTDLVAVAQNNLVIIYENPGAMPHAWIVHEVRSVDHGEALPLLTSGAIDPRQIALVEGSVPDVASASDPEEDRAQVTAYKPDAIDISTRTDAPGLLVVSEIYAEGWRAYVDGEVVAILPTDLALRGVPIPAGEHTVELRYEPRSLRIGVPISGASALLVIGVFAVSGWRWVRS